jgi:2-polyprenyl-6-hydroxyphenyl methylase/3-demethylubiquinone-9 3-methyltransferase
MRRRNDLSIYDRWAPRWWAGSVKTLRLLANLVPARLRHFDRIVGSWADRRVVDLGCGGGFMAEAIAARGARVVGVDPCEAALEAARGHARETGLPVDYRLGAGEAIPLPNASADVVVCVDVLEHVADVERTVAEVARVLVPGGLLLYDTVNRTALARFVMITLAEDLFRWVERGTHDPALFLRPDELDAAFRRHGLEPGGIVGIGVVGLDRRLDVVFGRVPTTAVQYAGHAVRRAAPDVSAPR